MSFSGNRPGPDVSVSEEPKTNLTELISGPVKIKNFQRGHQEYTSVWVLGLRWYLILFTPSSVPTSLSFLRVGEPLDVEVGPL